MKTKIRTSLIICALGLIGLTVNAANYRNEESLVIATNSGIASYLLNEDAEAMTDFRAEAQMISKWVADQEEAKVIEKLVSEGLFLNPENFEILKQVNATTLANEAENRKDANQVTKSIADNEESKAVRKLVEEGKLAEIW